MVADESWQIEQAASLRVLKSVLEFGVPHAGLQLVLVDANHPRAISVAFDLVVLAASSIPGLEHPDNAGSAIVATCLERLAGNRILGCR
jgi:hypothetical protein